VEPGHYGSGGGAHNGRDLGAGEAFHIGQIDRETKVLGQLLQRALDVVVRQSFQSLDLG
jgi:hypothetical protein